VAREQLAGGGAVAGAHREEEGDAGFEERAGRRSQGGVGLHEGFEAPRAQARACGVEALLHGRERQLEEAGDALLGLAAEIVEGDRQALGLGKRLDRAAQPGARLARREGRAGVGIGRRGLSVRRAGREGAPPGLAIAVLRHDAAQPAGERGRLAELAQMQEGVDEGVLGGVAGALGIAEAGPGGGDGEVLETSHQGAEGAPIAALGALDQRGGLGFSGSRCLHGSEPPAEGPASRPPGYRRRTRRASQPPIRHRPPRGVMGPAQRCPAPARR
jgi:hypothetical protein